MLTASGPVQVNYTREMPPAHEGMLASEINWSADSRIVETAAGIGFGLAVSQGVQEHGCKLGGNAFVGITRADPSLVVSAASTVDVYPQYDNIGVLVMGDIWVKPSGTVNVNEAVYYNTTTGVLGGSGGALIDGARWMTGTLTGGFAIVRIGNISGNM